MGMSANPGAARAIVGSLGDGLLGVAGKNAIYAPAALRHQEMVATQAAELQRQMALAKYKVDNPDPTATMQNAAAIGLKQGTPEYVKFVTDATTAPHYITLGSPETGQTVINPGAMPTSGPAGPPSAAVERLRSNPGEASQFDAIFGAGAAQRALGGQ